MLGITAAFLSSFTWAIGSQEYSRLSKSYPPYVINFNRAFVSLPFCVLALIFGMGPQHLAGIFSAVTNDNLIWLCLSMLGSYAFADVLFFKSTLQLGVPAALSISAVFPIWSALAGWLLKGESLQPIQWLGLVFAVIGVVIVILTARFRLRPLDGGRKIKNANYWKGVFLALTVSFLYAFNTYAVARGGSNMNPMLATTIRMIAASFLAPLVGMLMSARKSLILPLEVYRLNGWLFVFESFGGSFFYLYGLTHAPLAIASAMSSLAPVIAVPIDWSQSKKPPRIDTLAGSALVISGVILLVVSS